MTPVTLRPPTEEDILYVAAHMREIDALECAVVGDMTPEAALRFSIESADWAFAGINSEPLGIFGVSPDDSTLMGEGLPWLLGTDSLVRHARQMLVQAPPYVEAMHERYVRLRNRVHADNAASIRWLKWLGFTFEDEPHDVGGHPFFWFEKAKS